MKAQYVGDIGDFGKVLVLKHLSGLGFRLGVNWVLTENDAGRDGKHRDYISYRGRDCLCCCDCEVLESIAPLARKPCERRTIQDIEALINRFAPGTEFYRGNFEDTLRIVRDQEAFEQLKAADIVFFDPDNGIGFRDEASPKHVYLPDFERYWKRRQSLLIYHHLSRQKAHVDQIDDLKDRLRTAFAGAAIRDHRLCRGTARVYFLCLQSHHIERVPPETLQGTIPSLRALSQTKGAWRKAHGPCGKKHAWKNSPL
jgi:hypothetical protein